MTEIKDEGLFPLRGSGLASKLFSVVASVALVVGLMPLPAGAEPADKHQLTIIALDQTYVYNGQIQGEGDTLYGDPAQIAEKIKVVGLQGDDAITSVIIDGQGTAVGDYVLTPSNATVGEHTGDYDITYVPGTLHIEAPAATVTITGNRDSAPYDGEEHSVGGYAVKIESNDGGYTEADFTGPAQADAVAKGTDVGTYPMGLTDVQFANTNERYAVTFKVTDGELEITAPPKGEYTCSEGGGTWTKGSSDTLTFSFKRAEDDETTFEHFTGIEVDGEAVSGKDASGKANWTAKSGSVVIDLQPTFLEELSEGGHTLKALFDDGEAMATFKVAAKAAPTPTPAPASKGTLPDAGDTPLPLTVASAIAATSAAMLLVARRKRAVN